jgi:hypothetical protein
MRDDRAREQPAEPAEMLGWGEREQNQGGPTPHEPRQPAEPPGVVHVVSGVRVVALGE